MSTIVEKYNKMCTPEQIKAQARKDLEKMVFYFDAGHGWLKVPINIFNNCGGIASSCSYFQSGNIYLEEDCDAPLFRKYFCKAYGITKDEFMNAIKEVNCGDESSIRQFEHWDGRNWNFDKFLAEMND